MRVKTRKVRVSAKFRRGGKTWKSKEAKRKHDAFKHIRICKKGRKRR